LYVYLLKAATGAYKDIAVFKGQNDFAPDAFFVITLNMARYNPSLF
jgi:hypothetical protein